MGEPIVGLKHWAKMSKLVVVSFTYIWIDMIYIYIYTHKSSSMNGLRMGQHGIRKGFMGYFKTYPIPSKE